MVIDKSINGVGSETFINGLQVDGKRIFLAGTAFPPGVKSQGYIASFELETRDPDPAFGDHGIRFVDESVNDLALSIGSDGRKRIIVVGEDTTDHAGNAQPDLSITDHMVARLPDDGQMDASFGKNGISLVSMSRFVDERALTLSLDQKSRIWGAGLSEAFNDQRFQAGVFRLLQ